MKFTKMHGCGNDYVYVDCTQEELTGDIPELARRVSDRHFGIGSDGLILIKASDRADFFMDIYNNDGSRAQMCGNGIRCVAKYVYDKGLTKKKTLQIDTLGGIKELELTVEEGLVSLVTVNMGAPILTPAKLPVISEKDKVINEPIMAGGKEYRITCVSMGNPHAVVFVPDTKTLPLQEIGPLFENHKLFPERINTEFVHVIIRSLINMRVWERGSGETLACGTGACASVMACILNGLTEPEVTVRLLGGELKIRYDVVEDRIYMTGPATMVFEGEFSI